MTRAALVLLLAALMLGACGKKGDPVAPSASASRAPQIDEDRDLD